MGKNDLSDYRPLAAEMLEKFEAVDIIAAALKSLTKEPNDTPIAISEERPLPSRGGSGGGRSGGGGGYKGKRSTGGSGGGRSSSSASRGGSDRGASRSGGGSRPPSSGGARRTSSGPRDGSTQRSTRTRTPRSEG